LATLDRVKEDIAYLKFWQGIVVVTAISLSGWLAIALATAGLLLLTLVIVYLHRRIEGGIRQIGTL
jgi:hypothetical protein